MSTNQICKAAIGAKDYGSSHTPWHSGKAPPNLLCALCLLVQTSVLCPILHKHTWKNILKSEYLNRYNINTTFAECLKKKNLPHLIEKLAVQSGFVCKCLCDCKSVCVHMYPCLFFGCNLNFLGLDKRQE